MCTAQIPIPPNAPNIQGYIDIIERISFDQEQVGIQAVGQSAAILKVEALRSQTGS
jgi:hypothetical protein